MSTPASVDNNDLVTPWLPIRDNSEKQEIRALTRAIQRANGFSLLFACCDQNTQRQRVLHELSASFPENGIQEVPLWERTAECVKGLETKTSHFFM